MDFDFPAQTLLSEALDAWRDDQDGKLELLEPATQIWLLANDVGYAEGLIQAEVTATVGSQWALIRGGSKHL